MKKYTKPSVMLFTGVEEGIATFEFDSNAISVGNDDAFIAPKVDDVW